MIEEVREKRPPGGGGLENGAGRKKIVGKKEEGNDASFAFSRAAYFDVAAAFG